LPRCRRSAGDAEFDPVLRGTPRALPVITVRIPDTASSGGTSPAGWSANARRRSASSSPSSACASRHTMQTRAASHPGQILFAHAAVSDASRPRLLHAQKIARAGFGLAGAATGDLDVRIDDWHLARRPAPETLLARIAAPEFGYALEFTPTQPVLWQGDAGFSQKSADPVHASHYMSWPQLAVSGALDIGRSRHVVRGRAWLDHEWSSALMPEGATGWDWLGLNLDDGGALMVFRMRDGQGEALWAAATLRDARGERHFAPAEVGFEILRIWRSPRTGGAYPVAMRIAVGARRFTLTPLMDDQELDGRGSSGAIYWEGAVSASEQGRELGRGYLELTGYAGALKI
jgi:predicted secreted hydrolase